MLPPSQNYISTSSSPASHSVRRWADGKTHDARLVLGAVAPVPLRAQAVEPLLESKAPSATLGEEVATPAVADAQPLALNKAKIEVVKALVRQVVLGVAS